MRTVASIVLSVIGGVVAIYFIALVGSQSIALGATIARTTITNPWTFASTTVFNANVTVSTSSIGVADRKILTVFGSTVGGDVNFVRALGALSGSDYTAMKLTLQTNDTSLANNAGVIIDFFGATSTPASGVGNQLGYLGFERSGDDRTGSFVLRPYTAGSATTHPLTLTAAGALSVTTTNAATSSVSVGCIQLTATSTGSPIKLLPSTATLSTTTFSGTQIGGYMMWAYGTCP